MSKHIRFCGRPAWLCTHGGYERQENVAGCLPTNPRALTIFRTRRYANQSESSILMIYLAPAQQNAQKGWQLSIDIFQPQ